MNTKAERQMMPGVSAIDDEVVRPINDTFVAVTRDVPHQQLVIFFNLLTTQHSVLVGGAAHIR